MVDVLTSEIQTIIDKPFRGKTLSKKEILTLLGLKDPKHQQNVFRAARKLRNTIFGDRIYLYGFVYLSTYCRNDCAFCYYRRSNKRCHRYRKDFPEILEAARILFQSGVHLIDLTMGEDPYLLGGAGSSDLISFIEILRNNIGLPIMVSPGVISCSLLEKLKQSGVGWYACYQETHNPDLFARLRPKQDYDARIDAKRMAKRMGFLVEEGLLCGVGEQTEDIVQSIEEMQNLDADQVRVMTFVPHKDIPLARKYRPDSQQELLTIAVLRLVFPEKLIPATLDVDGLQGLRQRLEAGANVVTSIVPPGQGLSGVAQRSLDIEDGKRMVSDVSKVLASCNLRSATASEYRFWMKDRRTRASSN